MTEFETSGASAGIGMRRSQAEINDAYLNGDTHSEGIGGRAVRGGAIAIASQVLRSVLQIVNVMFLARLLTPDAFGVVALAGTVMAFFAMVTDLGVATLIMQRPKLDQDTVSGLWLVNIGMSFATVALVAVFAPLAAMIFQSPDLILVTIAMSLYAPLNAIGAAHHALLMRNMKWLAVQSLSLGAMAAGVTAGVLAAWLTPIGYWALVVQTLTAALVGPIASWTICAWRPSRVRNWAGAMATVRLGLNLTATAMLSFAHRQIDNMLIGWRWGATELGYYSRAYNLMLTPMNFVTGPISSAMLPSLSRLQLEPERWRAAYLDALIVVAFIGAGMATVMFGAAAPIIELVLGPGWGQTEAIFAYLALILFFSTPMSTTGWIYISLGNPRRQLHWALLAVPVYVGSFVIGLPDGATGVARAYSFAQIGAFIPCFLMAIRGTRISLLDIAKALVPPLGAGLALAFALRAAIRHADPILDLVAIAAAGLAYVAILAVALFWYSPYARLKTFVFRQAGAAFSLARR